MAAASRGAEAATASLVTRTTVLGSTTLAGGLAEVASEPGQGEAPEGALEWPWEVQRHLMPYYCVPWAVYSKFAK